MPPLPQGRFVFLTSCSSKQFLLKTGKSLIWFCTHGFKFQSIPSKRLPIRKAEEPWQWIYHGNHGNRKALWRSGTRHVCESNVRTTKNKKIVPHITKHRTTSVSIFVDPIPVLPKGASTWCSSSRDNLTSLIISDDWMKHPHTSIHMYTNMIHLQYNWQ
jgi:hypothetical protein